MNTYHYRVTDDDYRRLKINHGRGYGGRWLIMAATELGLPTELVNATNDKGKRWLAQLIVQTIDRENDAK